MRELEVRVREWEGVNKAALTSVHVEDDAVRLHYADVPGVSGELQRLVDAEQTCCGPAGVSFAAAGLEVTVSLVTEGKPARTVLAAFADMSGR